MGFLGWLHHLFWVLLVGDSLPTLMDVAKLSGSITSTMEKEAGSHVIWQIPTGQVRSSLAFPLGGCSSERSFSKYFAKIQRLTS